LIPASIYGGAYLQYPEHIWRGCGYGSESWYYYGDIDIHICDEASGTRNVICGIPHQPAVEFDGIDAFAVCSIHEDQHRTDYFAWWDPGGYDEARDGDHDRVPDLEEPDLGYDPNDWDTDNDYKMDSEDHAYDAECGGCQNCSGRWIQNSADAQDWANPGHQY
jgi:hypothetical protein